MIEIKAVENEVDVHMGGNARTVTAEMILIIRDFAETFAEHNKTSFNDALNKLCVGATLVHNNPESMIMSETEEKEFGDALQV
jgi:hypothetical protein